MAKTETKGPTPAEALDRLKKGNKTYVAGKSGGEIEDSDRREVLAKGQHPFAVIVSCSDSRVPPERLFGVGLGHLFVIRVAGNTVDATALGSILYAVQVLEAPLIVVMGHEKCGAVVAAKEVVQKKNDYTGAIGKMLEPILPAVIAVREKDGDVDLDKAVRENAKRVARALRSDPSLAPLIPKGLEIHAARYDLEDGKVEFLEEKEKVVA